MIYHARRLREVDEAAGFRMPKATSAVLDQ